jgi:soluble lytic murein transglycosylase-like protein
MRSNILLILLVLFLVHSTAFGFCFHQAGETYRISPELLSAIAKVESGLNPSAMNKNKNGSYDVGLMQINSCWEKSLGPRWRYLSDPCYNVMVGSWILRQCMNRYGYSWDGVACYHTGKGLSDSHAKKQALAQKYIRRIQTAMASAR